ncbi:MAG: ArsA family ATPase [Thermoanaerobaculia bacterium]
MSAGAEPESFATLAGELARALEGLASRRVLLFGGKGGVGKTTLASLAAIHAANAGPVILFSTDPASNLHDLFGKDAGIPNLTVETVDAPALWRAFLDENLERFVELGDRGTYLDREEIRKLFELSVPGIDELMGWLRIGELAEQNPDARVVVDTAPTGHTLRLLSSPSHFEHFSRALDEMQAKHRALVEQLARRTAHDALDEFVARFRGSIDRRRALLTDRARAAFVPVFLAEPWVVAQTERLVAELRAASIDVPFAVLNHAAHDCDCDACRRRLESERQARARMPAAVVRAPRSCVPLDDVSALRAFLAGEDRRSAEPASGPAVESRTLSLPAAAKLVFFAGKGGVGKTTVASSVALQLADRGGTAVLISVDPAHSIRDVFDAIDPPPNLRVETIDTKGQWNRLRARVGDAIESAIAGLTAPNVSISHDSEVLRELVEIAPPGADEIFAIMRLASLLDDPAVGKVIVDTAPTGHFLRLLELPATAGAWARELMRLLLRYKDLVPTSVLGEELLNASKALKRIEGAIRSDAAAVVIVSRAERLVVAETRRLEEELSRRGVAIAGIVVNALTPATECSCDRSRRAAEIEVASTLGSFTAADRAVPPPTTVDSLRRLIPLE